MRLNEPAAGSEPAHGACSLQWRYGNRALTDRNIEGLGGIPRLLGFAPGLYARAFHSREGIRPDILARQIDSCPPTAHFPT